MSKDINNSPLALLGVTIATMALAGVLIYFCKDSRNVLLITFAIVTAILALVFLVFTIIRAIKISAIKKLIKDDNSYRTTATFLNEKMTGYSSTTVNGNPVSMNVYKKIIYVYQDENGKPHIVTSILSYFPQQVEYLKNLDKFQIVCKGSLSAIIEPIPRVEGDFNM